MRWMIALLLVVVAVTAPALAERQTLDRPVRLFVRTTDGEELRGLLTAFDDQQFELVTPDKETVHVDWSRLPAARVYAIHERLLSLDAGEPWLVLGKRLRAMEGGEAPAERALRRAEAIDPSLAERVARVRRGEPDAPAEGAADGDGDGNGAGGDGEFPLPPEGVEAVAGPRTAGAVQHRHWGPLDDAEHAAAIEQLDAFAKAGLAQIGVPMRRLETEFFLFYTDIPADEAVRWARLLDRMYARLSALFGVEEGRNIWRGKCLILVFARDEHYHRFEAEVHGSPSLGTAGRCWGFGDGTVHVTFYRQPDELSFAHVLVHEAVHGFLHRYRSPVHIPSWVNEGLADVIAQELLPDSQAVPRRQQHALAVLRQRRGDLGGFFDLPQIEAWHYGLASALTEFMIRQHKAGYVEFVNGIKDGLTWRESLEQRYGTPLDRLLDAFGQTHDIDNLTP